MIPTVPKEIFDFPAKTLTRGIDEIPTHMREDPDHAGEKIYYHAKSKFYGYVGTLNNNYHKTLILWILNRYNTSLATILT